MPIIYIGHCTVYEAVAELLAPIDNGYWLNVLPKIAVVS